MNKKKTEITSKSAYLELMKKLLIDYHKIGSMEAYPLSFIKSTWKSFLLYPIDKLLRKRNFSIQKLKYIDKEKRMNGLDWPANAMTMIGYKRLSNIEDCIRHIKEDHILGDLIETGVWRGGAVIFMKAVLNELDMKNRTVWLADSFQGLPKPKHQYESDRASKLHKEPILRVTRKEVENNFQSFDLLDDKVKFIEGWFENTLDKAPIQALSLLRLDGDLYESTIVALNYLYPKLSIGGFVIIDDFNAFPFCKKAVLDYRFAHGIKEEIIEIDKEAVFWRKEK